MIIVEGPDGSGKDTLITNLGHHSFKLKALRGGVGGTESYYKGNGLGDGLAGWAGDEHALVAYTRKILAAQGTKTAFNRFHLSEAVYGPILRGTSEVNQRELVALKYFLQCANVPVILCLPSFATCLRNVEQPGRERPAYQTDAFLAESWSEFAQLKRFATHVYDFTTDPIPTV